MTSPDALLAAVLAEPDDDLPRLMYADYLDELGNASDTARAEFIRVQCALNAQPAEVDALPLRIREKLLQHQHGRAWLAPLQARGMPLFTPRSHGQFRRGFVEIVWMPAGWFVDKAAKLFRHCPVRELRITHTTTDDHLAMCAVPDLLRLHRLDISDRKLGNITLTALPEVNERWKLQELILRACGLDDDSARVFDGLCPQLTLLDISLNRLSEAAVRELRRRHPGTVIVT